MKSRRFSTISIGLRCAVFLFLFFFSMLDISLLFSFMMVIFQSLFSNRKAMLDYCLKERQFSMDVVSFGCRVLLSLLFWFDAMWLSYWRNVCSLSPFTVNFDLNSFLQIEHRLIVLYAWMNTADHLTAKIEQVRKPTVFFLQFFREHVVGFWTLDAEAEGNVESDISFLFCALLP